MMKNIRNVGRARSWLRLRDAIRGTVNQPDRENLLRRFGEEIRALMPMTVKASPLERDSIARAHEVAVAQGVLIGAWLQLDPLNPTWPGRDRLYVIRREDLVNSCSVLSTLGFFPPEQVADIVDRVDAEGRRAAIPGLESPGVPAGEIPGMLWESAVESARSKKRWRAQCGDHAAWADPSWRDSPAVWRSCAIVDVADPVAEQCRALPGNGGETPAGLVAVVTVARTDAESLADKWLKSGWVTTVVNRNDSLGLYNALTGADMGRPFAVMLALGSMSVRLHISRTALRRREAGLLGEMSDEQFNEVMGAFLE
ncbi:MAG: hypothetical protein LBS30_01175 [Planctomycetota bacterium]|jgi:hypothetical protein|nr:hypothetical protein [Planctomycetota bacterium]